MACNSCQSTCACVVIGDPPITVTGIGTAANPYVVDYDLCNDIATLPFTGVPVLPTDRILVRNVNGTCNLALAPASDSLVDNGDGTFTHTAVDGTVVIITIPDTDSLVNNGDGSFTHTATDGVAVTIDVCELLTHQPVQATAGVNDLILYVDPAGTCKLIPAAPVAVVTQNCIAGTGTVADPIRIATPGTWAYPCAVANGVPIVCDGTTLRGMPEHTCVSWDVAAGGGPTAITPGSSFLGAAGVVANPSPCRAMTGVLTACIDWSTDVAMHNTGHVRVVYGAVIDGNFIQGSAVANTSPTANNGQLANCYSFPVTIAAGGTMTLQNRTDADEVNAPFGLFQIVATANSIRGTACTV